MARRTFPWSHTLALMTLALCACSSSDDAETGSSGPSGAPGGTSGSTTGGGEVTFYEDVAPIVYENCLGCHRDGGIASFSLVKFETAAQLAPLIKTETQARRMPPWHADNSGACNTYKDARWLTEDQIGILAAWADGGALPGDPANAPELPPAAKGLDKVSATVDIGATYTPDDSIPDDYRCFVVDPGITTAKYLTGYEVKPGEARVVHHVILFALDTADAVASAEQLDASDEGLGYTCFGGSGTSSRFLAGWAPGTPVTYFPEGTGLPLEAGRKVVIQVHYNLANGTAPDRTTIDLRLDDQVTTPASIEIMADPGLSLPPGNKSAEAGMTTGFGQAVTVYGAYPHMHQLGRTLRVEKDGPGGTGCMIDVPDWNFHWQQLYLYEKPLELSASDSLNLRCTYDTTSQQNTVTWGEGTADEMCVNFFYVTQSVGGCSSCADVATGTGDLSNVCAASQALLDPLIDCACINDCATACGDNACTGGSASDECTSCLQSSCAAALDACLSDG